VEGELENVETPLASESQTEYLMSSQMKHVNILVVTICLLSCYTSWNVNILEVILYLLLCYTSCIITSHCIETYFSDNITFIAHLCNKVRSCRYDFDIVNVRIYVYCNIMPANGALQPKYIAEIGTCKIYSYKFVACHVFMCT